MRAWLLVVGCCLYATVILATPVPSSAPEPPPVDRTSRQSADPAQPVAAAPQEEEDDDDDDDDDDVDLDLGDDDDDDDDDDAADDDDDDDDDEDYFERFFDDILGDDDDDDDEDDEEVAAPPPAIVAASPTVAPTAAPPQPSVPQGLAAASVEENGQDYGEEESLETEPTNTVVLTTNDQDEAANSIGTGDTDDDDAEDDDDEDEDEEDDDEDDDDLVGDIEAKQARSLNDADVAPPAYIVKYNRFVDTILDRINKILRKSYDPVNVRLQSSSETKKNKNKNKKRKNKEKQSRVTESSRKGNVTEEATEMMTELTTVASLASTQAAEPRKRKQPTPAAPAAVKNKTKSKTKSGTPRAKATLYGLSSIQREGDVTVNVMSSHTTVKTRFLVGPLVLKVEKEFGRGAKKELRSATATTAEMTGKLNLRVLNGGVATLHSIKVLQPKQVRVESPDDHDRTREFVWRRSSSIAKLVSEKLLAATKSMLQPPPTTKPTAKK